MGHNGSFFCSELSLSTVEWRVHAMCPWGILHKDSGRWIELLLLLLQIRTQPHLGCCLAAATGAASAIFMHLCTNSATPYTSRQHMRSCNDPKGLCAPKDQHLTLLNVTSGEKLMGAVISVLSWQRLTSISCIHSDRHDQPCCSDLAVIHVTCSIASEEPCS
jgi:hypothetical protein